MPPDHPNAAGPGGPWPSDPHRRRLAELAASRGEAVPTAGNRPVRLDDPASVWFVERGSLDVFLVGARDGSSEAPFHHALRLEAGRLAFGATGTEDLWLVGKGLPETVLRRIPAGELTAGTGDDASRLHHVLAEDADVWTGAIVAAIAAEIVPRPRADRLLTEGARTEASGVLTSAGGVVWVEGAEVQLFGTEDPEEGELVPLTPESWVVLHDPTEITVLSSHALGAERLLSRVLPGFHRLAFGAEILNRQLALADHANLQVARSVWRQRDEDEARRRLFGLLAANRPPAASGGEALLAALRAVARHDRIFIHAPADPSDGPLALADLLLASGVRARRVRLSPEDRWWRGDSGAMLAFRREDGSPVALLPGTMGRYRLRDPKTGRSSPVRAADADTLAADAWVLYRPLLDDGPAGARALLASASGNLAADITRVVVTGFAASVLALAPAAGIGVLIEHVIPSGTAGTLLQVRGAAGAGRADGGAGPCAARHRGDADRRPARRPRDRRALGPHAAASSPFLPRIQLGRDRHAGVDVPDPARPVVRNDGGGAVVRPVPRSVDRLRVSLRRRARLAEPGYRDRRAGGDGRVRSGPDRPPTPAVSGGTPPRRATCHSSSTASASCRPPGRKDRRGHPGRGATAGRRWPRFTSAS